MVSDKDWREHSHLYRPYNHQDSSKDQIKHLECLRIKLFTVSVQWQPWPTSLFCRLKSEQQQRQQLSDDEVQLQDRREVQGQHLSIILLIWDRLASSRTLLHLNESMHPAKSPWTKGRETEAVFHSVVDVRIVENDRFYCIVFLLWLLSNKVSAARKCKQFSVEIPLFI